MVQTDLQDLPALLFWSIDLRVVYSCGIVLVLAIVCWLFNKYSSLFQYIPANRIPVFELVILGVIWWWGAIGSGFGFLLLIITLLVICYQTVLELRKPQTGEQSVSEIQTAEAFE